MKKSLTTTQKIYLHEQLKKREQENTKMMNCGFPKHFSEYPYSSIECTDEYSLTEKYFQGLKWRFILSVFVFSVLILGKVEEMRMESVQKEFQICGIRMSEVDTAIRKEFDFANYIPYTLKEKIQKE